MKHLDWLVQRRFTTVLRREADWCFTFDENVSIATECLWRLIENDRIRFTSEDEGQWFGLSAPVDPAAEIRSRLPGAMITSVELSSGTLDLRIHFNTGHILELIRDSSGYEAWSVTRPGQQFVAGGGELAIFDQTSERSAS